MSNILLWFGSFRLFHFPKTTTSSSSSCSSFGYSFGFHLGSINVNTHTHTLSLINWMSAINPQNSSSWWLLVQFKNERQRVNEQANDTILSNWTFPKKSSFDVVPQWRHILTQCITYIRGCSTQLSRYNFYRTRRCWIHTEFYTELTNEQTNKWINECRPKGNATFVFIFWKWFWNCCCWWCCCYCDFLVHGNVVSSALWFWYYFSLENHEHVHGKWLGLMNWILRINSNFFAMTGSWVACFWFVVFLHVRLGFCYHLPGTFSECIQIQSH